MAEASFLGLDWGSLLSVLLGAIIKGANDWLAQRRAEQAREDLGRAEERERAQRERERQEEEARKAAEEAAKRPPEDGDGFERD